MENKEDKEDKKEKEEDKNDADTEVAKVKEGDKSEDRGEISEGIEETEKISDESKNQNKQLKKIFFVIGLLSLFFFGVFFFISSQNNFEYQGIKFSVDKQQINGRTLYRTSFPVDSNQKITGNALFRDYRLWFRTDPRTLEEVPFDGEINLRSQVMLNSSSTKNFHCDGDGIIAIANLGVVLGILDRNLLTNEIQGCDSSGEYTFLQLQSGDETKIEQFGPSCYNLYVNNCEVLKVTEKYLVKLLSEANKELSS